MDVFNIMAGRCFTWIRFRIEESFVFTIFTIVKDF